MHGPARAQGESSWILTAAVASVVVVALAATVMVKRADFMPRRASATAQAPAMPTQPVASAPIVQAPPLAAMGAPAGCPDCGTVEAVVAVGRKADAFQMHIRMDDGSLRTIAQRGALPAGSRVKVDGRKVSALAAPG